MSLHFLKRSSPLLLVALAGCTVVGPNYTRPTLGASDLPEQWASGQGDGNLQANGNQSEKAAWWLELDDSLLNTLVRDAFKTSPSLEEAVAKLREVRASLGVATADYSPTVSADTVLQGVSDDSLKNGHKESTGSVTSSWELDLFGAATRTREGAQARHAAQVATVADVRVSLAADVADAYVSYRGCQSNVSLAQQDLVSRVQTERITLASVSEGFTAPYQAIRSKASIAEAKTSMAATVARCERLKNQLTSLTGVGRPQLDALLKDSPVGMDALPVPRSFNVSIPTQAIEHRPDIRAAERLLAAASADIGVAEANRYPRLMFNGSLGYTAASTDSNGVVSYGSWSFGPSLSVPIFDAGKRKAAVKTAENRYQEVYSSYKDKVRTAVREVEDALSRYAAAHERSVNAVLSAKHYEQFYTTVEARYKEGASSLLELEDARRVMLGAQQTLLGVQQERLQAWVALNRATGGGADYAHDTTAADKPSTDKHS